MAGIRIRPLATLLCLMQIAAPTAAIDLTELRAQAEDQAQRHAVSRQLDAHLRNAPDDLQARLLLAQVSAWQNDWPAARRHYDQLLARQPEHVDALLGKAQVEVWSGTPDAALPLLAQARAVAPDYRDLWRLELQALAMISGHAARRQAKAVRADAAARFPDEDWRHVPALAGAPWPLASEHGIEISLGGHYEALDRGQQDWQHGSLGVTHVAPDARRSFVALRNSRRFGRTDTQIEAGRWQPLSERISVQADAAVSPASDVLARWSVHGQLSHDWRNGWIAHLSGRHSHYSDVDVDTIRVGVERYWRSWRFAYGLSQSWPSQGTTTSSHDLRLDHYYQDHSFIGIGLNRGREVVAVAAETRATDRLRGIRLIGRHWFDRRWGIGWELGQLRQGDLHTRNGIRLDVHYRY